MHRSGRIGAIALCALLLLSVPLSATAKHKKGHSKKKDGLQECINSFPIGEEPICVEEADGSFTPVRGGEASPGSVGTGGSIGGFVAIAIFWALIPMGIAMAIASSRGQSVGLAFLATLILGWLGLLLVALFLKEGVTRRAAEALDPQRTDAASQIRKLADLRADGVLTDEEFEAKKASLLDV